MPDESDDQPQTVAGAKVDQINAILESGAEQVTVDGTSTKLNHDTLRKERDRIIASDPALAPRRRRRTSTLDLSGGLG